VLAPLSEPVVQKPFTPEISIPTKPKLKEANPNIPANASSYWKSQVRELAKYYGFNEKELIRQKPERMTYREYYYKLLQKLEGAKK
jgi:hypothetical protein